MGLARKTALLLGAGLLLLLGVVAALSLTMVMGGYEALERRLALRNLERLRESVANLVENLDTKASDWSNWDDTYEFVSDGNQDYIDSNLGSPSMGSLGLAGLVILDVEGRIVVAAGHDPEESGHVPGDAALLRAIEADPGAWAPPEVGSSRAGLVRVDDGLMLVAIRPIVNSQGEGPARGAVVFAARLDEQTRAHLAQMIRAGVTWSRVDEADAPRGRDPLLEPAEIRTDADRIYVGGLIAGLDGRPALRVEVATRREVTAQGWETVRFSLLVVIASGLLLGLATDRALRVLVLGRVARLSEELSEIAASGESSGRVTVAGRDEIARLAGEVNGVLWSLDNQALELRRARQKAEDATRAKSEFLAAISHDVRSPLAVVLGSAEVLGDESLSEQDRREHLGAVARNVRHALVVVSDLLDHTKIEAGRMTLESVPFSPCELARESMSLVDRAARAKGLEVRLDLDPSLPESLVGDPTRLRQILMNLLGNAVKFTSRGWVALRSWGSVVDGRFALRFEVQDTGIGLSEEQIGGLFEAYRQAESSTTRKFGGTGLGLWISRALARQMGGDVTATGRPGEGATFVVEVVCGLGAQGEAARDATDAESGTLNVGARVGVLGGLRVLVADDGEDNRRLLAHHLRRHGAEVVEVGDGREALDAVVGGAGEARSVGGFDAVILDINMPELDGREAALRIRAAGFAGGVIAATAGEGAGAASDDGRPLFDHTLIKPIAPGLLVEAVRSASARSRDQRRAA